MVVGWILGWILLCCFSQTAFAGVAVQLVDGKRLQVDRIQASKTLDEVELSVEAPGIMISRRVELSEIAQVYIGEKAYDGKELVSLLKDREIVSSSLQKIKENEAPAQPGKVSAATVSQPAPFPGTDSSEEAGKDSAEESQADPFAPRPNEDEVQREDELPVRPLSPSAPRLPGKKPAFKSRPPRMMVPGPSFLSTKISPVVEPGWIAGGCGCRVGRIRPLDAQVLGVRADPLSAYRDYLLRYFPNGVPVDEAPFVQNLLRAKKADEVLRRGFYLPAPLPGEVPGGSLPDPPPAVPQSSSIQRIKLSAHPISSQGKTDWDALSVEVLGYDEKNRRIPIRGTLQLTLWGQRQELIRAYGRRLIRVLDKTEKLASWTRTANASGALGGRIIPAAAEEHGSYRAVVPLPRPLPDHDVSWAPLGELHARLTVPGEGVLETTQPNVVMRHFSVIRDQEFLESGSRFFAQESTSGSRIPAGSFLRSYSSLRPNGRIFSIQP